MRTSVLVATLAGLLIGASFSQASPLLETQWNQRGDTTFAKFSPDHWRLGCWSTAFAQILYHHRLAPYGSNSYTCSDYGYHISEDFDSHTFDWRLFTNQLIAGSTPVASINEVALYSYFTSVVIEKDFGTGTYVLGHSARAAALEDHYDCTTEYHYIGFGYDMDDLKADIVEQIDVGCPLMVHLYDSDTSGYHAVAIDDYQIVGDTFEIHINMGWGGSSDGYYDIAQPVLGYETFRRVIMVTPPEAWPIPGDANYDGQVNEEDAAILAEDWGSHGVNQDYGDFNDDGVVGPADAAILAANWGYIAGEESAAAVPEPSTTALLIVGLVALLFRRRGRLDR